MGMNPEIRAQWIAALRSGEYKQARGMLTERTEDGDKHCCLGVLCQLAVEAGVVGEAKVTPSTPWQLSYEGSTSLLPRSVAEWAGLDAVVGAIVVVDGERVSLPQLNDGNREIRHLLVNVEPFTFEQIADVIEANLWCRGTTTGATPSAGDRATPRAWRRGG
jgi:hypothetical protein